MRAGDETALDVLLERSLPALRKWARGQLPNGLSYHVVAVDAHAETAHFWRMR